MDGGTGLQVEAAELGAVPVQRRHARGQVPGRLGRPPGRGGELGPGQPPQQPGVEAVDPARRSVAGRDPLGALELAGADQRAGGHQGGGAGVFPEAEPAQPGGQRAGPPGDPVQGRVAGLLGPQHQQRRESGSPGVVPAGERVRAWRAHCAAASGWPASSAASARTWSASA